MKALRDTAWLFDLDGTVTRNELLPLIAKSTGLGDEMRILTDLTLTGAIDFRQSFKLRVALLATVPLNLVHRALLDVEVDSYIKDFIQEHRDDAYIVTGNLDLWVNPLLQSIGVKSFASRGVFNGSKVILESILDKAEAAIKLRGQYRRVISVGDSFNDIPMFEQSDIGIAYAGTHAPVGALIQTSMFVVKSSESLCRMLRTL